MIHVPLMQFQYISDAIDSSLWLEEIGVFGEETSIYDSPAIVFGFKMRIREANEDLLKAGFGEILAKMPHCVSSYNTDMIIFSRILNAIASNFFRNKVHQFISNLHTKNHSSQKQWSQAKQQPSISASNIYYLHILSIQRVWPGLLIEGWMFNSVAIGLMIFLHRSSKLQRIVRFPINKGMMCWKGKRCCIERVDMRSHSIIFLLGYKPIFLEYFAIAFIKF